MKSLGGIKNIKNYIVLDIETTGLNYNIDDIIEIGAVKIENNEIVDNINLLIRIDYQLPEIVSDITGITNEMLKKGYNIYDALILLLKFIKNNNVIVGHNIQFDIDFINYNLKQYNLSTLKNEIVDTLFISKKVLFPQNSYKLVDLKRIFNIKSNDHRALDDCISTYKLFENLKELINNEDGDIE